MSKVVIIGAGGHARETLGIFLDLREKGEDWNVLGFVDDNAAIHGQILDGKPVLGSLDWFVREGNAKVQVICAIGSSITRFRLVQRALDLGLDFCNAISPYAIISPFATLAGPGITVAAGCIVNSNVVINEHSVLNVACSVSHDSVLDPFSTLAPGVRICGSVRVGTGCDIGAAAAVTQGNSIGSWTIVGAGAVVLKEVPANVTVVGVPARIIEQREAGWEFR